MDERLAWVFTLYDINRRGFISQSDLLTVVSSVYDLLGSNVDPPLHEGAIQEHVEEIFKRLDLDSDGVIRKEDFMETCQSDLSISSSLHAFDTKITHTSKN